MIEKITLKNAACYKQEATLETDKKVNLVYGLNGTGKSTLSNFLYYPEDEKYKDCSITGLTSDHEVLVYSQKFISENLFEPESINGIFTLSEENKQAKTKIKNAEDEIKKVEFEKQKKEGELKKENDDIFTKHNTVKNQVWNIKKKYTGGDRILEFCFDGLGVKNDSKKLLEYMEEIPKPSSSPEKTIDYIKKEAQILSGENAQKYSYVEKPSFSTSKHEENPIFSKSIVGTGNSTVSEYISKLQNSDWIKTGLQYLPKEAENENGTCPFCQAKSISSDLIDDLKNYFDESYEADCKTINELQEEYLQAIASFPTIESFNSNPIFEEKKQALEIKLKDFEAVVSQNQKRIESKVKAPSSKITLISTKEALENINTIIDEINTLIQTHNSKIDSKGTAIAELKTTFWNIMRWDYDTALDSYIKDNAKKTIKALKNELSVLDIEIEKQKTIIVEQQKETVNIEKAVSNINDGLIQLGIDEFKIIPHTNSMYKISRESDDDKIFRSLSEGEKMIISFLYFIELCRGRKNANDAGKRKIVLIDDPISSLSHIYVFNVGRLIHNEFLRNENYEQIFILTHSLYFFYELTDTSHDRRKETQKLFRLRKNASGTNILPLKYEEIQNDYHAYWYIIKDENQPPALIANCMRNVIEYFFNFVEKKDLSAFIQKKEMQENRFQAFCRYINRESHSLGQNIFDIKEFNYLDFKDAFACLFNVTGYEAHYKKMIK